MTSIRKFKLILESNVEPYFVEIDPCSTEMQRGPLDASPKQICNLAIGDQITLHGQLEKITNIIDVDGVPTSEQLEQLYSYNPTRTTSQRSPHMPQNSGEGDV